MSEDVPDRDELIRRIRAMPTRESGSALAPHITLIRELREKGLKLREIKAYLLETVKVNRSVATLQEFIAKDEKRERARRRRERMRAADPGRSATAEDVEPSKSPAAKKQRSSESTDRSETPKVNAPTHGKKEALSSNTNAPRGTTSVPGPPSPPVSASNNPAPVSVAPRLGADRPAGGSADFLKRLEESAKVPISTDPGRTTEDLRLANLRQREEQVRREDAARRGIDPNPLP